MVTSEHPKISRLHAMIEWVNTKPGYLLKPIAQLPLDTSQLNTNSWLAGFAEGDGSFQIRISEGRYRHVATCAPLRRNNPRPLITARHRAPAMA